MPKGLVSHHGGVLGSKRNQLLPRPGIRISALREESDVSGMFAHMTYEEDILVIDEEKSSVIRRLSAGNLPSDYPELRREFARAIDAVELISSSESEYRERYFSGLLAGDVPEVRKVVVREILESIAGLSAVAPRPSSAGGLQEQIDTEAFQSVFRERISRAQRGLVLDLLRAPVAASHGDLTLRNVVLGEGRRWKVIDFSPHLLWRRPTWIDAVTLLSSAARHEFLHGAFDIEIQKIIDEVLPSSWSWSTQSRVGLLDALSLWRMIHRGIGVRRLEKWHHEVGNRRTTHQ